MYKQRQTQSHKYNFFIFEIYFSTFNLYQKHIKMNDIKLFQNAFGITELFGTQIYLF